MLHCTGGFKYLYFHPYLGKWSILTNIFEMGWNHQLDNTRTRQDMPLNTLNGISNSQDVIVLSYCMEFFEWKKKSEAKPSKHGQGAETFIHQSSILRSWLTCDEACKSQRVFLKSKDIWRLNDERFDHVGWFWPGVSIERWDCGCERVCTTVGGASTEDLEGKGEIGALDTVFMLVWIPSCCFYVFFRFPKQCWNFSEKIHGRFLEPFRKMQKLRLAWRHSLVGRTWKSGLACCVVRYGEMLKEVGYWTHQDHYALHCVSFDGICGYRTTLGLISWWWWKKHPSSLDGMHTAIDLNSSLLFFDDVWHGAPIFWKLANELRLFSCQWKWSKIQMPSSTWIYILSCLVKLLRPHTTSPQVV